MKEFAFYNPTKILFGSHILPAIDEELRYEGKNVLLVYGGGSIKKNGIYDEVTERLRSLGKTVIELSGVMPNPRREKVREGIRLCRSHAVDFILAVGGGSVIDCAKAIAIGAPTELDFWSAFYVGNEKPKKALPIGVVLTLPASGSEMNHGSVITDWQKNYKIAYHHPLMYPRFALMDPTYTYSLSKKQTVYGAVDMLSHLFECYFSGPDDNNVSDALCESLMTNIMQNLSVVLKEPENYEARSNLMWDGCMALNGITQIGKNQDWQSHQIEHAMSAFFDVPHGAGLAVIHPAYMKYTFRLGLKKYVRYAENVWHLERGELGDERFALRGIEKTREYFRSVGAPTTLRELGIQNSDADRIVSRTFLLDGGYCAPTADDIRNILLLSNKDW